MSGLAPATAPGPREKRGGRRRGRRRGRRGRGWGTRRGRGRRQRGPASDPCRGCEGRPSPSLAPSPPPLRGAARRKGRAKPKGGAHLSDPPVHVGRPRPSLSPRPWRSLRGPETRRGKEGESSVGESRKGPGPPCLACSPSLARSRGRGTSGTSAVAMRFPMEGRPPRTPFPASPSSRARSLYQKAVARKCMQLGASTEHCTYSTVLTVLALQQLHRV